MSSELRLMCVFAHPDDESFGMGATLAKYAAEGAGTYLVTATRGERGWQGVPDQNPGMEALGKLREGELREAAGVLGLREVEFLDYIDGDVDRADPAEATGRIAAHLRRVRPQVVVTFGPDGGYGHPDHIAVAQLTSAAVVCATDPSYAAPGGDPAHRVSKLYTGMATDELVRTMSELTGPFTFEVDDVGRSMVGWPAWMVTTRVDASAYLETARRAVACHKSQLPNGEPWKIDEEQERAFIGQQTFYRVFSLVNGGRAIERDLFAGLRPETSRRM